MPWGVHIQKGVRKRHQMSPDVIRCHHRTALCKVNGEGYGRQSRSNSGYPPLHMIKKSRTLQRVQDFPGMTDIVFSDQLPPVCDRFGNVPLFF